MNEIPNDLLSLVASYLWFKDISSLSMTSVKMYHGIHSDGKFWVDLVDSIVRLMYFESIHVRPFLVHMSQNFPSNDFVFYLKQILLTIPSYWPRMIDTKIFSSYRGPENIVVIDLEEASDMLAVLFTGPLEESARSIVANDCFPYLPTETEEAQQELPFTKIVCTETTQQLSPRSRHVSMKVGEAVRSEIGYFECTIHRTFCPPTTSSLYSDHTLSSRQSFSIGLACPPFSLKGQFPGYDNFSLGYRSDDGAFYQGSRNGIQFGGEPYGSGDVVGCGIIYPSLDVHGKGKLFFTRNGQIQGRVLEIASDNFFTISWFPVLVSHPSLRLLASPLSRHLASGH
jgi:hypothetical protein